MRLTRKPLVLLPVLALVGVVSACGSDSDSSSTALPQAISDKGYLTIGTEFAREGQFIELADGTFEGFEADLSKGLGKNLGIEIRYNDTGWLNLNPALDAGDIDIAMAQLSDYPAREQTMTMVNYLRSGSDIIIPSGNPNEIATFLDLCGLSVGAWTDSIQSKLLAAESDKCPDGTTITIASVDSTSDESLADSVATGAADAWVTDSLNAKPIASAYGTGSGTALEVVRVGDDPAGFSATPIGIGVGLNQTELVTALQAGLQEMIDNGTYQELLNQYGLQDFAVNAIDINTAGQ